MFSTITSKLLLVMGVALFLTIAATGAYFWYSQDQLAKLHESNGKLKSAVDAQASTIRDLEGKFKKQAIEVSALQKKSNLAIVKHNELIAALRSYDLASAARTNRAEAEAKINSETAAALKALEELTGAAPSVVIQPSPVPTTSNDVQPPPRPPAGKTK